jgi:hypothetical protein
VFVETFSYIPVMADGNGFVGPDQHLGPQLVAPDVRAPEEGLSAVGLIKVTFLR